MRWPIGYHVPHGGVSAINCKCFVVLRELASASRFTQVVRFLIGLSVSNTINNQQDKYLQQKQFRDSGESESFAVTSSEARLLLVKFLVKLLKSDFLFKHNEGYT